MFPDFFLRIELDWRALVKSCIPNIEKLRGLFLYLVCFAEIKYFFLDLLRQKSDFFLISRLSDFLTFF